MLVDHEQARHPSTAFVRARIQKTTHHVKAKPLDMRRSCEECMGVGPGLRQPRAGDRVGTVPDMGTASWVMNDALPHRRKAYDEGRRRLRGRTGTEISGVAG